MGSKSTTLDTRVVDWLGHSGASLRGAVLEEIFILSLSSGRVISTEVSLCSGMPQAVVSLNDWIFLNNPKANWTYVIITDSRKSLKLVTFIVIYHNNTDRVCIHTDSRKKLEACDIHSDFSPQHRLCLYSSLQLSRDGDEPAESTSGEQVHWFLY